jgi:gluconolactonase
VRFPDPAVEVVDERFRSLVVWQEVVERLWTGGRWLEGPVWFGDGRYLLFSDIPNNRMLCWSEITRDVRYFVSRRTTATATPETAKGDS